MTNAATHFDISCQAGTIHCRQYGAGERLLIAFHGFGDTGRVFDALEPALAPRFTIVCPDLPFHGRSAWTADAFELADIADIVEAIKTRLGAARCSLMGYSFGARIVFSLLPEQAGQTDRVFLLAPDGIQTQGMGLAARIPLGMRRRLASLLTPEGRWAAAVRAIAQSRYLPQATARVVLYALSNPERHRRAFGAWRSLDAFAPDWPAIKAALEETGLSLDIFYGVKDEVIEAKALRRSFENWPQARLHPVDEGHRLSGPRWAAALQSALA